MGNLISCPMVAHTFRSNTHTVLSEMGISRHNQFHCSVISLVPGQGAMTNENGATVK
jgi:hypothetical protein